MGTAIRDDFVQEKGGNPFGGDGFLSRAENHPLSKSMVDHDQKRVKAHRDRKIHDQITQDLLERARGGRLYGGKWWYGGVHVSLVLLASGTTFDVLVDIGGQARPPELGHDKLASLEEAKVSGRFMVMAAGED